MYSNQVSILKDHFSGAGRSTSRVINQRAIVDMIYQERGISKAQLAKRLGISKPAVTSNVEDLISIGLVLEKGEGESTASGGRKPVLLYFNQAHSYIGALDLSFPTPVCTICDLKFNIIGMEKIPLDSADSLDEQKQCIKQAFIKILLDAGVPLEELGIVIISQPGVSKDGTNTDFIGSRHRAWVEMGLRSFLEQELSAPVMIKNDVNLAAVGEVNFGTERRLQNLIYVSCGIGLGAGLIIQGELYEGSKHAAGEIGYMLRSDGGYVENGVTKDILIQRVEKLYAENGKQEKITFPFIVEKLKSGDALIEQVVFEIGRELGRIIQNCCILLDISTVIFGGEYLELGPTLFDSIRDFMKETTIFRHVFIPSSLKDAASLYGGFVVGKETLISSLIQVPHQVQVDNRK